MALLRARESFSFDSSIEGSVAVRRGELFPEDHPFIVGRENLFEPAENAVARVPGGADAVETATASPGVRRNVSTAPATTGTPPRREGVTKEKG
jgi:hypothetical protein